MLGIALLLAIGCSDDVRGTDILVGAPGGAGSSSASGGSSNRAGSSNAGEGGATDGGASDGGAAGANGGASAGSGGNAGGGSAGLGGSGGTGGGGGNAGSGAGTGGSAGSAGSSAGTGGHAGSGGGTGGLGGTGGGGSTAGSSGSAGSGGTSGGGSLCGNGNKDEAEECDDMGPSRVCSDDCRVVATAECVACEQGGDCAGFSDNCLGPDGSFSLEQVGLCYDVMRCIQDSSCLDGTGTVGKCYCGTLTTAECSAATFDLKKSGAPNGPCAALMQLASPGVTSNSQMLANLFAKTRPGGAAGQRLNCQKNADDCRAICGVE